MTQEVEKKLREMAEKPLMDQGLEILDVELKSGSLRVTLDSEAPLDLDRIAKASTLISRLIDDSAEFDQIGQFNLEVSSPGVERTLRTESHFKRFVGSKLSVKMKQDFSGPRRISGVLKNAEGGVVTIQNSDAQASPYSDIEVKIDDIERARTVFEWGAQKPPKAKSGSGSKRTGKTKLVNEAARD